MSRKRLLIPVVIVLVVLMAGWWGFGTLAARRAASRQTAGQMVTRVTRGNIDVKVSGTGTVEAGSREDIRATLGGAVLSSNLENGLQVQAGQVLLEVEVQDLSLQVEKNRLDLQIQQQELEKLYSEKTFVQVTAEQGGELTWHVKNGDRVQSGALLATIVNREIIEVAGKFDPGQINSVKNGQNARLYLPRYQAEFTGQVTDVGTVPRPGEIRPPLGEYYEVTAEITGSAGLFPGGRGRMTVLTATGQKQAAREVTLVYPGPVDVRSPVTGNIQSLQVKDGATAAKDQLLAEVFDSQRQAQLQNQIWLAEARLNQLQLELAQLLATENPNPVQVNKLQLDIDSQISEINRLYAEQVYAVVRAPERGDLIWKVREGDRVQEGSVIATIQDKSVIEVTGHFTHTDIPAVAAGQAVEIYLAGEGKTVQGKVTSVSAVPGSLDRQILQALYDVRVTIDNKAGYLGEGMQGILTISTPNGNQVSVQEAALSFPRVYYLRAPVAGTVTTLVTGGQKVTPGRQVAEIDDSDRETQLKNQIASAEIRLRQLELDLQDKITQQADRTAKSRLKAPICGEVITSGQTLLPGDNIQQGTVLGYVADYSRLKAVIPVDELDVAKIRPGQEVRISADALPGQVIQAEVHSIAREGRAQGGVSTFDVTILINEPAGLRVGMSVSAEIMIENRSQVLLVPLEAIQRISGRTFVALNDTAGVESGEGFRLVAVETGVYNMSWMEIVSGVQEGQEIIIPGVTAGQTRIPGVPVMGGGRVPGDGTRMPQPGNEGFQRPGGDTR